MYSKIELSEDDANMVERPLKALIKDNEEFVQCKTCKADWGKYGHAPGCTSTRAESIIERIHETVPQPGFKPTKAVCRWLIRLLEQFA